ncbi:MAG: flavin reductase family protein [Ruminococcaceae bacterium]|nr:flavin reductase family protein [Oscillospiraceae bacterium]
MSKIKLSAGTLTAPVPPTLVSCGSVDAPNAFTVAWTGILNTKPPMTYISVRPSRYSYELIKNSGEFVINLPPSTLVRTVDLCGVKSGRDIDKFKTYGLSAAESFEVSAPSIEECPVSIECRVKEIVSLGTHDMFISDIVGVSVKEELINKNGKLCLDRAGLMAYVHGEYFTIGKKIGSFGYSVKKPAKKSRNAKKKY